MYALKQADFFFPRRRRHNQLLLSRFYKIYQVAGKLDNVWLKQKGAQSCKLFQLSIIAGFPQHTKAKPKKPFHGLICRSLSDM